jgi:DNA ligase-1
MALRFARVLRYRDDKTAAETDTVDTVRALHVS